MPDRAGLLLLLLVLVSSGCSCAQALRCTSGTGDEAACRAMSAECTTVIESRCLGECPPRCRPDEATRSCALDADWRGSCPADARIFDGHRVGELARYTWKAKALSPAALALASRVPTRDEFDALTVEDRRQLCGGFPADPCAMAWDEAKQAAGCTIAADTCAKCRLEARPVKCIPINTCSGVICL